MWGHLLCPQFFEIMPYSNKPAIIKQKFKRFYLGEYLDRFYSV